MAICRCKYHSPPRGIKRTYVGFVLPVGYPDTALICGRCDKPALIWLDEKDTDEFHNGNRVFTGPNNFTKVKTKDDIIKGIGHLSQIKINLNDLEELL